MPTTGRIEGQVARRPTKRRRRRRRPRRRRPPASTPPVGRVTGGGHDQVGSWWLSASSGAVTGRGATGSPARRARPTTGEPGRPAVPPGRRHRARVAGPARRSDAGLARRAVDVRIPRSWHGGAGLGWADHGLPLRRLQGVRHPGRRPRPAQRPPIPRHRRGGGPVRRRPDRPGGPGHARVRGRAVRGVRPRRPLRGRRPSSTSAWPPPTCSTSPPGSLDAPGAMFTASHNPARYNGLKLCLSGARPDRPRHRPGRDPGHRRVAARRVVGGRPAGDRPGDARRPRGAFGARRLRRPRAVVRGHVGPASAEGGRRHGQRHGWPGGPEGLRGRCPSRWRSSSPSSTATSPTTRPTRSSPRTWWRCRDGARHRGRRRPGLRRRRRPGLPGRRARRAGVGIADHRPGGLVPARQAPGATVLYNCICSRVVPEVIAEKGGIGVRTKVGHSFIKQVMAETGAVFGGEHSGHYYFRDNYRADSGIIAAMLVLELLSVTGQPLSELLAPVQALRRLRGDQHRGRRPGRRRRADGGRGRGGGRRPRTADRLDGLTVDRGDWWYNLRPSNTEPLLRLNVEAPDEASCAATGGRGAGGDRPTLLDAPDVATDPTDRPDRHPERTTR